MRIPLEHGDYAATINTFGAALQALTYRGHALVETFEHTPPPLSAGMVLAPWPNRLADGTFTYGDAEYHVPITEPERNNALHGMVDRDWDIVNTSANTVELTLTLDERWPFDTTITAHYSLDERGLKATYTTDSTGPSALGVHTYLRAPAAAVDDCTLHLSADSHLELSHDRLLPTGASTPAPPAPWVLRGMQLDDCFHITEPVVTLNGPHGAVQLTTTMGWLQIYTAADYPHTGRALAVEPMSAPPNALNTGVDLAGPGRHTYTLTLSAHNLSLPTHTENR
ncbi:hypothetical protein [Corynebacterium aquilae]|uniref:aldose epimerase family protein n=1 Tax=Corynebacterium aquilae TaxID=203263 RepID=UPI000952AA95|nr:hypothetical protein [Corynebacterium aquilae]